MSIVKRVDTQKRSRILHPKKNSKNWKGKKVSTIRHDEDEIVECSDGPDDKLVCMVHKGKDSQIVLQKGETSQKQVKKMKMFQKDQRRNILGLYSNSNL